MRTFKRASVIDTEINIPFKAICPVPDPPRMYYGTATIRYASKVVLDFNEVEEALLNYIDGANRSAEDIAEFLVQLVRKEVEVFAASVWAKVEIPAQPGHLFVTVRVS